MGKRRIVAVTVTQLRRHWGRCLALSRHADLVIYRRGAPIAVLVSVGRYRRLAAACRRHAGGTSIKAKEVAGTGGERRGLGSRRSPAP